MSSGMNVEQAKEYAKTMTYRQAIGNLSRAKGIEYRKATRIKLRELAEIADTLVRCKECKNKDTYCDYCHKLEMNIKADDFCSYGERKESE